MEIKKILFITLIVLGGLFSNLLAQDLSSCQNPQIMRSDIDCIKTGEIKVSSFKYQSKNLIYTGIECVKIKEAIALLENVKIENIKITQTNNDPFLESKLDIIANSVEERPTDCEKKILKKLVETFDIKYEIVSKE